MFGNSRGRSGEDPPFWRQQMWILSVAFIVGSALLAAAIGLTGGGGAPAGSATGGGAMTAPVPCAAGVPAAPTSTLPPDDLTWQVLESGKRIPVSASNGPRYADGQVLRCFAHTTMGAVLAAHVVPTQLGEQGWRATVAQQVIAGTGRDVLAGRLDFATPGAGRSHGSYAGYSVVTYSPQAASVRLLVRTTAGQYVATVVEVRWDAGDWKVQPSRVGEVRTASETVTGNAGFTMWKN
ncbi:hypothetical protein ACIG87_29325 [Micromonospora sp. NPDC051925]|uniref:hypothetical protein n=1 Tax=Micromonospora sp. NPDC051925 TaxID=3364288 RepID=UPI0037C706D4